MQIQSKLDTLNQLTDSPEVSKKKKKSGEQGRITGEENKSGSFYR